MAITKRDVQLVVRARDEATRVVDKYAESIAKVTKAQNTAGSSADGLSGDLVGLLAALADVEKANGLVSAAADRADASFKRQSAGLSETRAQLAATRAQIDNVQQALANGPQRIVDTLLGGGDASRIRAEMAGAQQALGQLVNTENRLAQSVRNQEAALGEQRSSLQQLGSLARTTETALASLGDETARSALAAKAALDAETEALRSQARAAKELADAQRNGDRFSAFMGVSANPNGMVAAQSAAVFEDQQRMADAAERLLQRVNPLYAIQVKLDRELENAANLYRRGALNATQYADAVEGLKREAKDAEEHLDRIGRGEKGKIGLFGLKPYEMTNLGYQFNDVVTQLASGTNPMQVLAQQGGQILQLLPNIGSGLVAALANPVVMSGVAVIGGLSVVLARASSEADRMRKIEAILARVADGAQYSAVELDLTAKAIQRIGLSSEQAIKQVESFVTQGLNPDYLIAFSQGALDLAAVTGMEVPEAAAAMRDAFTGGYEAVVKLDDQLQFLTVSERELIRTMFESGNAADAREMALKLYNERIRDSKKAADEAKGAFASLKGAVNDFLDALANTSVIEGFTDTVREQFQRLARDIRNLSGQATLDDLDQNIASIQDKIQQVRNGKFLWLPGMENFSVKQASLLTTLQRELNSLLAERTRLQKEFDKATGDTVNANSAKIRKARSDRIAEIEFEKKLALTTDEREKIRIEGEKAYREAFRETHDELVALAAKKARTDVLNHEARMRREKELQKEMKDTILLGSPLKGNFGISSGFNMNRKHPVTGKRTPHPAIDYKTPVGTPVYAPADGTVEKSGIKGGNGLYIKLDHGSGTKTFLLHLDESKVQEGQFVNKGDLIGRTGGNPFNADGSRNPKAGTSTGPHLDYRMEVGGKFVNPLTNSRVKGDPGKALADSIEAEEKRAEAQEKFNQEIDDENEKRRLSTMYAQQQAQLAGDKLFESRKQQSIDEAIQAAEQKASKQGLELDQQRRDLIKGTVAAEWDLANARERANSAVDDASGERQALLQQLETARQLGDELQVATLEDQIKQVDDALRSAIDNAIKFWEAFNTPEARTAIAGLKSVRDNIGLDNQRRERQQFEDPLNQLQSQRSGLMEQIQFFRDMGQMNVAEELRGQLRAVDADLLKLIDTSLAWWRTHSGPEAQAAILQLEGMRNQILASQQEFSITAGQIQQMFAGSLSESVKLFAQRLVETKNPIRALGEAAINFAASFMEKIADAILQIVALKLAMKIGFGGLASGLTGMVSAAPLIAAGTTLTASGAVLSASGGVLSASAAMWMATASQIMAAAVMLMAANAASGGTAGIFHSGGIAGSGGRSRPVAPAWFAGATRYHSGGLAGFAPNEVPIIAERGEEILQRSDPRHRMNGGIRGGGAGTSGGRSKTEIIAIGDKEIVSAMASASGEEVVLRMLKRNKETVRQMLRD